MSPITCLIVDDESLAQDLIENHLSKIPNMQVVGKLHTAVECIGFLANNEVDLLFLDVEMPDLTGLELLKALKDPPITILITAYSEYALDSYDHNVVDYLLKPVKFDRFVRAIAKANNLLKVDVSVKNTVLESSHPIPSAEQDYIFVKSNYKAIKVRFSEIVYVESAQKYVKFHLANESIMSLMSLTSLEGILPENTFFRSQKSFIVNLNEIKEISGNQLLMSNGSKISVSKNSKPALLDRIDQNKLL
ncbi:LytTR family DNA-binding domain-containing protein [Flavobacteriaceae bacterium S356]|uniref:LytTR family DNA-binding domain-containing protein n=1 Tax=Asprobacillus argus TaxID=3076534 RepID=A0ABU3LCZ7_9FLAO|nr:LytTR family DNA-binding domain-containing protein [Flavobacteriaceae bacterium S356]